MFQGISTSKLSPEEIKAWLLFGGAIVLFLVLFIADYLRRKRPAVTVSARVFAKRQEVSGRDISIRTYYYMTFEFIADGSRREFRVDGTFYSALREGETGYLTYRDRECLEFGPTPAPEAESLRPSGKGWRCSGCNTVVPDRRSRCPGCGSRCLAAPSLPE